MKMPDVKEHTLEAAILALHSVDADMARFNNGVGFNGGDTGFGNSLAFQVKKGVKLSPRQLSSAHRMLRKYKVQLLRDHGIDYGQIPRPEAAPATRSDVTGEARMSPEGAVVVKFSGFPGELLAEVKAVPGARYDRAEQTWGFPLTIHTASSVEAFDARITVGADVKAAIADITRKQAETQTASKATEADIPLDWAHLLYGFQRAGVAYALDHKRTFIGDEMGLGKTVQAIATLEVEDAYPYLVVAPANAKPVWERELNGPRLKPPHEGWVPHRSIHTVEGQAPYRLPAADITIINYDLLPHWVDVLRKGPWRAVVFDESHYLKNGKTKRTKASKAIAHTLPIRLHLTGTPILNRPFELVSQLDVMGRLEEFGGFWPFVTRYCGATRNAWGWDFKGATNLAELHERLTGSCMVRRTKDQVLSDLPPKLPVMKPITFDRTNYDRVDADLKVWLKARILAERARVANLAKITDADEAEAEAQAIRKERNMGRAALMVKIEALKQEAAKGKLTAVTDWTREFLESGRKLVLFGHHKSIIAELVAATREAGYGVVSLTGDSSKAERRQAETRFQTEEDVRLFVGNMEAAGVAITLTAASDVAFCELPWRPGDIKQASDRVHRIGQENHVTVWYLLAANTIEETIAKMLDAKSEVVDAATDGKTTEADGESLQRALMDALEKEAA